MEVVNLSKKNIQEVAFVLCEAFYIYPVMKYVLGEKEDYDNRFRKLVTFFVSVRAFRDDPMFGIFNNENKLIAAATTTMPGDIQYPEELIKLRENLWKELGSKERARYENYGNKSFGLLPKEPHHHLNMIGVRNAHQVKGLAKQLINEVEKLVSSHSFSSGVSLNTEVESNVNFYIHLGFQLLGKTKVDNDVVTWGFFKTKKKSEHN